MKIYPCRHCGVAPRQMIAGEKDAGKWKGCDCFEFQELTLAASSVQQSIAQILEYWNRRNENNNPFIKDK